MHGQLFFFLFFVANALITRSGIILSYVTKHLISFVPLENFKVHVTIGIVVSAIS